MRSQHLQENLANNICKIMALQEEIAVSAENKVYIFIYFRGF
jgi:hypothetical protein